MTLDFFFFIAVGFCARVVDGALGMAFGVLSTTSLLAFGVPAAEAGCPRLDRAAGRALRWGARCDRRRRMGTDRHQFARQPRS